LNDPEVVVSIRRGVENSARQGLAASAQDIVDAFQDWAGDLEAMSSPVTVYHGTDDPNVPIAGVREFVRDQPDKLRLVEETEGGGQLSFSHIDRILDLALTDTASVVALAPNPRASVT
jgi:pimeloyl-ACP methyl ester carboxylesterase